MRTTCLSHGSLFVLSVLVLLLCEASRIQEGRTEKCSVDKDCQTFINGSICNAGNCTCPQIMSVVVTVKEQNSSYCLPGFNVTGSNCTYHIQCNYDKGKCTEEGVCGCNIGFMVTEEGSCAPHEKSAMIPIAVGIAIGVSVLGTLCLYLWLSRKKEEETK